MKSFSLILKLFPAYLVIGLLLIFAFAPQSLLSQIPPVSAIFSNQKSPTTEAIGKPTHLSIESLGIDLKVIDGHYQASTQTWFISSRYAHYATVSDLPKTPNSHTVIYGHNTHPVLGKTTAIKPNDLLTLTTDDQQTFTYRYLGDIEVNPQNTSIFDQSVDSPTLTLITCSGFFDTKRRLLQFEIQE